MRFNTQPPEGGWSITPKSCKRWRSVSTHSRLKAAGPLCPLSRKRFFSFNTQPPEGGWRWILKTSSAICGFNTQPPEGGWADNRFLRGGYGFVSTHSRLKAAGCLAVEIVPRKRCFNTQPPEGGWIPSYIKHPMLI